MGLVDRRSTITIIQVKMNLKSELARNGIRVAIGECLGKEPTSKIY